jgi:uncharacterized membrane protein
MASIVYVIVTPRVGERFTEFYILGTSGKAEGYPRQLAPGQSGQVILGVVNHEYARVEYRAEVRQGEDILASLAPNPGPRGKNGSKPLTFAPRREG